YRLAGLVVPIRESSETSRNILDYCNRKLPKYKVPASLLMVETIPKNSSGKPDRLKSLEFYEKSLGKKTTHYA
ncbi:MAG: hypothetical protein WCC00_11240, partial [Candidatus Aminicenantales bacterium]